jgi:hypothetical protein
LNDSRALAWWSPCTIAAANWGLLCHVTSYGTISRDVGLQALENKVLSWGIIGISAPILAEITIQKSQPFSVSAPNKFAERVEVFHVSSVFSE